MIDFEDPLGLEKPQKPIPRALLWAALVLMMVSVSLAGYSRATGNGAVREVEPREAGIPLWVSFAASEEDQDVIEARAHPSGDLLLALESGEGGFLRGVVRPLQRERMRFGVDQSLPYRLTAHANGQITLADDDTGVTVDVAAFGGTSVDHFRSLFLAAGTLP